MRLANLPLKDRALLAVYPWRRREPVPRARLARPLEASRLALVTTAGLVVQGDEPFDLARRGGDPTYRTIPHDTPPARLGVFHRSAAFDRSPLTRDMNVVFPRDAITEAARDGRIGSVAPRHLSFMGSITAPGRLIREYAPQAGAALVADGVDVALLVPVWPFCHQTVSLVASVLESLGIVTVALSVLPDISGRLTAPRTLVVPFGLGSPLGPPGDSATHARVVAAALDLAAGEDPVPAMTALAEAWRAVSGGDARRLRRLAVTGGAWRGSLHGRTRVTQLAQDG